jgi:hypothetical protein
VKHYPFSGSDIEDHNAGFHSDAPHPGCALCHPATPADAEPLPNEPSPPAADRTGRKPGPAIRWWRSIVKWGQSRMGQSGGRISYGFVATGHGSSSDSHGVYHHRHLEG